MPEPVLVATLVTALFTGVTQLAQMFFDYKKAQLDNQHEHIYTITSACCSTVNESDHETESK